MQNEVFGMHFGALKPLGESPPDSPPTLASEWPAGLGVKSASRLVGTNPSLIASGNLFCGFAEASPRQPATTKCNQSGP